MIVRRFITPVVAAMVLAGACGGDPPPPPPPPPPQANQDSLRAYQDSVRRAQEAAQAEAARLAAERAAAAERERRVAAARATLEDMVFFDYDMSNVRDDAAAVLRRKVDILRASPQVRLRIEGHADERGSTEYNLALGNRRAESIRQFLVGFGLSQANFEIVSFGEGRPLQQGQTEAAWARNRRGQFVITAGANAINPGN
ncbi:MAG: peptidoglycan-associated lipoprotein [Gemmatimonadetes bacterium]|nr:peptidoglycan-associated lipoprotein [Gemmatimonadota bacterium]